MIFFLSSLISHLQNSSILLYLGSFSCLIPSSNSLALIVTSLLFFEIQAHPYACTEPRGEHTASSCSIAFCLTSLRWSPSLNLGLAVSARLSDWQTRGIFAAHVRTHTATPDSSFKGSGGVELRSSHWCSKNPYLLSYLPSHKTLFLFHSVSEAVATSLLLPCSGLSLCQTPFLHCFVQLIFPLQNVGAKTSSSREAPKMQEK